MPVAPISGNLRPLPGDYARSQGSYFPDARYMTGYDINSILGTFADRGIWPYYDELYVAIANGSGTLANQYTPFAIPLGQIDAVYGATKTKVQTNMIKGNEFGSTRCLIVEQIGIGFPTSLSKANVDQIVANMYLEFKIAEKIFYEGRAELWPSGTGLMGVTTQQGQETWTLGLPVPAATRRFGRQFSKYIAPLINFSFTIYFPQNLPVLTFVGTPPGSLTNPQSAAVCVPWLQVYMDGVGDRAVQ
jgi:hypothetical protein